jgi:hypothetical protein
MLHFLSPEFTLLGLRDLLTHVPLRSTVMIYFDSSGFEEFLTHATPLSSEVAIF